MIAAREQGGRQVSAVGGNAGVGLGTVAIGVYLGFPAAVCGSFRLEVRDADRLPVHLTLALADLQRARLHGNVPLQNQTLPVQTPATPARQFRRSDLVKNMESFGAVKRS